MNVEDASIDQVEFIGKTHWAINYTQNEIPTRLFNIISDDGNYLITIALSGVDTDEIEQIETYFSTMERTATKRDYPELFME